MRGEEATACDAEDGDSKIARIDREVWDVFVVSYLRLRKVTTSPNF